MVKNVNLESMRDKLEKAGLLPMEKQAQLSFEVLHRRLETVLPEAMKKSGVDLWLIMGKENNEDPIMKTLFTWDIPHARRISILAFYYDEACDKVKRMSIGPQSTEMGRLYEDVKKKDESIWDCVGRIVSKYDPKSIAINRSNNYGFCDGISATLYDSLLNCLTDEYRDRLCSGEDLSIRWLEKTTDLELELMKVLVEVTQDIIKMCFSRDNIVPGVTNTKDLEWLMRETISQVGFDYWFGPDVDLQRKGGTSSRLSETTIENGNLLHCDIGIVGKYLQLHTDLQWLAYVLKPGEYNSPKGLGELFSLGQRFQDIVSTSFNYDLSGNEVFTKAVEKAKEEGLAPMLYSHPLGTFGHGAGPTLGLYDNQGFVSGSGERLLEDRTCFALELNVRGNLPEWDNQEVFMYMEEDIYLNGTVSYIHGRQKELINI